MHYARFMKGKGAAVDLYVYRVWCVVCGVPRVGSEEGLTTASCSGSCPKGKYSNKWGLT
jgi:hypothetical protein